jgi:hypothetical protein
VLAPPNVRGALVPAPNGFSGLFLFCDITDSPSEFGSIADSYEKLHVDRLPGSKHCADKH